jgi:hypothetical protein
LKLVLPLNLFKFFSACLYWWDALANSGVFILPSELTNVCLPLPPSLAFSIAFFSSL